MLSPHASCKQSIPELGSVKRQVLLEVADAASAKSQTLVLFKQADCTQDTGVIAAIKKPMGYLCYDRFLPGL